MTWTSDTVDQLRALWGEGHSTAEIGRRMGISKNAVVGKAHRLRLPRRPSPIRPATHAPSIPRAGKTTLPRVHPFAFAHAGGNGHGETDRRAEIQVVRRPPSGPMPPARTCQWQIGAPRTAEFRFCDAPVSYRSYCAAHAVMAYARFPSASASAGASEAREGVSSQN